MKNHTFGLLLSCVFTLLLSGAIPSAAQDPIVVTWFVGLGTGTNEEQIAVQEQVVADFNASHDDIQIELIIENSRDHKINSDILAALIADGSAPDIIGPTTGATTVFGGFIVGYSDDAKYFNGQWLDLQPLIDASGYDLSIYPARLVDFFRTPEGLVGIPFMAYPSLMFYNTDLFDEIGMNYLPSDFGEPYVWKVAGEPYIWENGTELEWNWATVTEIAKIQTYDENGNDATMPEFDPSSFIQQFGFVHQWSTVFEAFSTFGGGSFYDAMTGEVSIPEHWREHARWLWERLWVDHTIPTWIDIGSDLLMPTAFGSGRVAMARVPSWYLCCIGPYDRERQVNFDLAPIPAYNGEYFAPTYVDAFRIHEATDNPQEAFEVLMYLQGEAASTLLEAYDGFPALETFRAAYFAEMAKRFPSVTNWDIINQSLAYAVAPDIGADIPALGRVEQRFQEFYDLLYGGTGDEIDIEAELDRLESDLQAIFDEQR